MSDHGRYRIVIADWALDASGPAHDVQVLEHVKDDGSLCLVFSTTLGIDLSEAQLAAIHHEKKGCP